MSSRAVVSDKDRVFSSRVHSALQTAQAWDDDPLLLAECRCMIPFQILCDDHGDYSEESDLQLLGKNHRFLRRLARFFKKDVMTWVNQPPCSACGSPEVRLQGSRGPESLEEKEGAASRVEVYACEQCRAITTFPRYNSCRKLLETRRGRCGEYANLFGLYCRACGFETRYVIDWTDHVWTEACLDGHWVMVDSCEAVVDECSMYELGWGKKLVMIVATAKDHAIDVTPRYTRQFQQSDFQARRRETVSSEQQCKATISSCNSMVQREMKPKAREILNQRLQDEEQILEVLAAQIQWEKQYNNGRISGSLAWKVLRQETGARRQGNQQTECNDDDDDDDDDIHFDIEIFSPPIEFDITIQVHSHPLSPRAAILVSGVACAVGRPDTLSIVVIDQVNLGCILQSRSFRTLQAFANFVGSIPTNRIVVVQGALVDNGMTNNDIVHTKLLRLAGFRLDFVAQGILFIGQVNLTPATWSICETHTVLSHKKCICKANVTSKPRDLRLVRLVNTRPTSIVSRLPDAFMTLPMQLTASEDQKHAAFTEFMRDPSRKSAYSGFTTRNGGVIYLLGATAFPVERTKPSNNPWTTWLFVPRSVALQNEETPSEFKKMPILFEVPLDTDFFVQTIGNQLVTKRDDVQIEIDTMSALAGTRLVAFYFSAHWCGPCRSFTPMLAELYLHLKEVFPTHGLEVVFVSSDRDQQSFDNYFSSMPWLAIPFTSLEYAKRIVSTKYGIQGIPSLVVLDSMTGQIVSDVRVSREEIVQACQRGDDGISSLFGTWMDRLPEATKDMAHMLEVSCVDDSVQVAIQDDVDSYLVHIRDNENGKSSVDEPGPMNELFSEATCSEKPSDAQFLMVGYDSAKIGLETVLSYIENCSKSPHNPRFRSFKLSNKIADRITHSSGGIGLILSLGLEVVGMDDDFYASIPVGTDLDATEKRIQNLLKDPTVNESVD